MYYKLLLSVAALFCVTQAHSESLFGEFQRLPDEIEKGFYLGADYGGMFFSGATNGVLAGETASKAGTQLSFIMGYDINKYFALESVYSLGIHTANPEDPNLNGGVNTFAGNLALKLQLPYKRWNPFVLLGAGIVHTEPTFKDKNNALSTLLGAGLEYYTLLRHYSIYAQVRYLKFNDLPVDALTLSGGLKYTF